MKKAVRCYMIIMLLFLCGSGLSFGETESILHEWIGLSMFAAVVLHLILNRRWFKSFLCGRYNVNRCLTTFVDIVLIIFVVMIAMSSMAISGYVFKGLNLSGAGATRKIHLVCTAWLLAAGGFHYGMHLGMGKRFIPLYAAGVAGIISFLILRFHERLFLLNDFAYTPAVHQWCIYLMHGLVFSAFVAAGNEIKRIIKKCEGLKGQKNVHDYWKH